MKEDGFWDLIISALPPTSAYSLELHLEQYTKAVVSLPDSELIDFARIHFTHSLQALGHPLWNAAYIINTGCGDDDFDNFRAGLIARGRDAYFEALRDPQTLADLPFVELIIRCEAFDYVQYTEYDDRHAKHNEISLISAFFPELSRPRVIYGIPYEEPEDLRRQYPILFDRFWRL